MSGPAYGVPGFRAAGVAAGLKESGRPDVALVASDLPCSAAGIFTTNIVKAAPVLHDRQVIAGGAPVRAVVANSGNANACTGAQGQADARGMAERAAAALGCEPGEVLVLSTGIIGVPMPMGALLPGIDAAARALAPGGWEAAAGAILTTDTRPKLATATTPAGCTITGIAKGAGMIAPNMATMLALLATDAQVEPGALQAMLERAAAVSFNRIVVDGDMSTNDTVLLLANGASGVAVGSGDADFAAALEAVCVALAQAIVRDGEGATKFVTLRVTGAATPADAHAVAHAVATSPLCKTAFYGADPNWGRVVAAAGRADAAFDPSGVALWLLDSAGAEAMQLVSGGRPTAFAEAAASALMGGGEWGLHLDLGAGAAETTVWTCDLSHEYVSINADYRT